MTTEKTRFIVVDGFEAIRLGVVAILTSEPDFEYVSEATNALDALLILQQSSPAPHLVITELALPGEGGWELIKSIKTMLHGSVKAVVYTAFSESDVAEGVIRAGAHGFVQKTQPLSDLIDAARAVARGSFGFSEDLKQRLLSGHGTGKQQVHSQYKLLSDREMEVFTKIGQGMTTQEIGQQLGLSPKTVETYRENIKIKLDIPNGTKLARAAFLFLSQGGVAI